MAAWGAIIAACVGAAATIYSTEANRGKGPKAPAASPGSGRQKVETPNVFGGKEGGGNMLGGGESKPVASLAGALNAGQQPQAQAPQQFGPQVNPNFLEDEQRKQWLSNLMKTQGE